MDKLTFVDENGKVLFTPKGCNPDTGYTINQLVQYGYDDILNDIAHKLANYEQRLQIYEDLEKQGKLLKLPCETVWFICDKKTKYATVMSKYIKDLSIHDIEGIDKSGYYFSSKDKAFEEKKKL